MASAFRRLLPTLNRIVVRKIEVENKTKSGIILTQKEDNSAIGNVIAVGPGKLFILFFNYLNLSRKKKKINLPII